MKVAVIFLGCLVTGVISAQVDPALRRVLKAQGSANILISFKAGSSTALTGIKKTKFVTREERLNTVSLRLRSHALKTQENVLEYLNRVRPNSVKSFWINNKIFVQNADTSLVKNLASFPEILEITEEQIVQLDPMLNGRAFEGKLPGNQWGVEKVHAEIVWNLDVGNSGNGVVVANIDTGVRHTHEALKDNFREDYGWFDPYTNGSTPIDTNGHGTHTMGTIAGANGIGVAPSATWIACRGCDTSSCSEFALLSCGQFMLCPTLPDGSNPDCTKAPHLVSNSWGGGQGNSMYSEVIESWYAADIVPLFSNGNSGPHCGSANSPADHPLAIAVGSTTKFDTVSAFSSKGPTVFETVKPDVSAPGTDVYSAWIDSDSSYYTASGTSMACPHAAGVVALLKSSQPDLSVEKVKYYLQHGNAQTILGNPGWNCGEISEDRFPNHAFGSGRLNAYNSLMQLHKDHA